MTLSRIPAAGRNASGAKRALHQVTQALIDDEVEPRRSCDRGRTSLGKKNV